MIELEYTKTKGEKWPISAQSGNRHFYFTANFDLERVKAENSQNFFSSTLAVLLWIISAIGSLCFLFSAYFGILIKDWLFIFRPSVLNLAFFLGAFFACYLWAIKKEKQNQQSALNLIEYSGPGKNNKIDIYKYYSDAAKKSWNKAMLISRARRKYFKNKYLDNSAWEMDEVTANDIVLALFENDDIKMVFWRLGVNIDDLKTLLKNYSVLESDGINAVERIPFVAFTESIKLHNKSIDPLMLLCSLAICLPQGHILQSVFFNISLSVEKLEIIASWIFNLNLLRDELKIFHKLSKFKPDNEINKGLTSVPTFYLDRFSRDLTRMAKHGSLPLALGRGIDLHEIFKLISSGSRNLLVKGESGTGRTTLINELAYKMATEQVPEIWQDKRLVSLEISGILGQPEKCEQTLLECLKEADRSGNIILVIEDIHDLARAQSQRGLTLLDLLVDFLQNHELMAIGTTTLTDYVDFLHSQANLNQVFVSYELSPLTREGIMLACCIRASILEGQSKCFFEYQTIEQAVQLTDLYLREGGQPQKAISVLVEASNQAKNSGKKIIDPDFIQKIISNKTHIPSQVLSQSESDKLLNLEEEMSKYIIGQEAAVSAVAEGLRRARSGLSSNQRPLASFLFLGPTGVGKTEVARVLSRIYFGEAEPRTGDKTAGTGEKYLLRLDMSEFRGPEGIGKLLGSADAELDPPLIKHIKNYPFCLLLLDEFEKASPEVLNLFLQVLEDGRLTTGRGETLDITHCLIIATSNAGTKQIQEGIRANRTLDQIKQQIFNLTLTEIFPPELLNRFDSIILFSPLSPKEVERITSLRLGDLKKILLEKGIKADFGQNLISNIAQNAFDPTLGARPIRRYIQDHLENFVAKLILSKNLQRGSNILIELENGQLVVK